jgi:hypothetical protein
MSHWGARTGYGYEAQRVAFLRETFKSERRHRGMAISPREDPSIAALARSMAISPAMPPPMPHLAPNRIFGHSVLARPAETASPERAAAAAAEAAATSDTFPSVATQNMVSFRPPDNDFLERFKAGRTHGKMHDKTTEYREQVFNMWNITGVRAIRLLSLTRSPPSPSHPSQSSISCFVRSFAHAICR